MNYATLFLIASAVLAMPTGQNADTIELAKKDAAPFRGSYMGSGWRNTLGNQFKNHNNKRENPEDVELAKKDAAPAGGWAFPTEEQDDPTSEKYLLRGENGEVPGMDPHGKNQVNKEDGYKNATDNNGISCTSYKDKQMKDIPEECMKPLFCKFDATFRFNCADDYSFNLDNWTKEKLIEENISGQCVAPAICKKEDVLNAPADWNGIF